MHDRTQPTIAAILGLAGLALATGSACAQQVIPQPVTDSSIQASPIRPVGGEPISDAAVQSSPVTGVALGRTGPSIAPHTPIAIELAENIDSGSLKQGQDVRASLSTPIHVRGGATIPAGAPVQLSVIASVPAGRMMPVGEFSLQILRIGKVNVYTNTLVFDGKPGRQDLPDSAPELGTNAGLPDGAHLTFHVLPAPTDDVSVLQNVAGPGAVHAIAPGTAPTASQRQSNGNSPDTGRGNSQSQPASPPNTTTNQQTQNLNQAAQTPGQMTSPTQPAGSTTPR